MNKLTNDELNQTLHTAMSDGECWHDYRRKKNAFERECVKCSNLHAESRYDDNPDYCESLDAVKVVRDFAIERVGKETFGLTANQYILRTFSELNANDDEWDTSLIEMADILSLSARQFAEICANALGLAAEGTT